MKKIILRIVHLSLFVFLLSITSFATSHNDEKKTHYFYFDTTYITSITFTILDSIGPQDELIALAKNIIPCKEGQAFIQNKLEKSITILKNCGRFQDVSVDWKEELGEAFIRFTLLPNLVIKEIKIRGEFPFFESEFRDIIAIHSGSFLNIEKLLKQKKRIIDFLKKNGFYAPKVHLKIRKFKLEGYCTLSIRIEKGNYIPVKKLHFIGNKRFSNTRLKLILIMYGWRPGRIIANRGRFVQNYLSNNIKTILSYYRKRGYADCEVNYKIIEDSLSNEKTIFIEITEGPRYKVTYTGDMKLKKRKLKNDVVFNSIGNKNGYGLRKSIKQIRKRYLKMGYNVPDIDIYDTLVYKKKRARRKIIFDINAGYRSNVSSIVIKGCTYFTKEKILNQMLTKSKGVSKWYVKNIFEEDVLTIQSLYLKYGFTNVDIHVEKDWSKDKRNVDITITINEGVQRVIHSVSVTGLTVYPRNKILKILTCKPKSPFQMSCVTNDKRTLIHLISEKGYPHVKVEPQIQFFEDSSKVIIGYQIIEDQLVRMGDVYYSGNFKTKKKLFKHEISQKKNDPFSIIKMVNTLKNIGKTDVLKSVSYKITGLKEKDSLVNLFVEVEEKKPYFLNLGTGYESLDRFYVQISTGNRNLFGLGKYLQFKGKFSQAIVSGDISVIEPHLFNSSISASLDIYAKREERKDEFKVISLGALSGLKQKINKNILLRLGLGFEQRKLFYMFRSDTTIRPRNILSNYSSLSYDRRDSYLQPRRGIFSAIDLDVFKGLGKSVDNFIKYRFDLRLYYSPFKILTFATRGQIWFIDPYRKKHHVPLDQLFTLGGTNTVRGYSENKLFYETVYIDNQEIKISKTGYAALIGNVETRFHIGNSFELFGFFDIGGLGDRFNPKSINKDKILKFRSSLGLGGRYFTPIGLVGLSYGFKNKKHENEDIGEFHFSVGYSF